MPRRSPRCGLGETYVGGPLQPAPEANVRVQPASLVSPSGWRETAFRAFGEPSHSRSRRDLRRVAAPRHALPAVAAWPASRRGSRPVPCSRASALDTPAGRGRARGGRHGCSTVRHGPPAGAGRLRRTPCSAREAERLLGMSPHTQRRYASALALAGLIEVDARQLPSRAVIRAAVTAHLPAPRRQPSSLTAWRPRVALLLRRGLRVRTIHSRLLLEPPGDRPLAAPPRGGGSGPARRPSACSTTTSGWRSTPETARGVPRSTRATAQSA